MNKQFTAEIEYRCGHTGIVAEHTETAFNIALTEKPRKTCPMCRKQKVKKQNGR